MELSHSGGAANSAATQGFPRILWNPKVHYRPYPEADQSNPSHPISLRSILILSTHLCHGLPSGLFPSNFPINILYAFLVSPIYICILLRRFISSIWSYELRKKYDNFDENKFCLQWWEYICELMLKKYDVAIPGDGDYFFHKLRALARFGPSHLRTYQPAARDRNWERATGVVSLLVLVPPPD
jgi:hypothetical protein